MPCIFVLFHKQKCHRINDSFIRHFQCYFQTNKSVTGYIRRKTETAEKQGITCQPQVLVLGSDMFKPDQVFVVINDICYEIDSIVKAVDTCMKCFFVYNTQYPVQAQDPWTFLHTLLYEIRTSYDKKLTPKILELVSSIKAKQ